VFVHRSNRTENLVEVLAEVVSQPVADPFWRECIAVQSRGMEQWLSAELARRLGVWANPDFPFPRHLLQRTITDVLGTDNGPGSVFDPESLMWSIADLLPAHLEREEFQPIRSYLADGGEGPKRLQLARRIADTFDHYVVYRPNLVRAWESGEEQHWQAVLWRDLVSRHGANHLAAHAEEFLAALAEGKQPGPGFPKRVCLFGISTLPPLYVQLLEALSQRLEMHLFVLSPSREYWAEIRSKRDIIRELSRRGTHAADAEEALHLEEGHPLLASLGRVGRDFQQVLENAAPYEESDRDLYTDPGTGNMLSTLQSDILNLQPRGTRPGNASPLALDPEDSSISIHSCHGPMREVEVLRDQLLALFDTGETLQPRDVVVMAQQIDRYAHLVEAVFGGGSNDQTHIPYCMADRSVRGTNEVLDAFFRILDVIRGRLPATEVLDLLGLDVIREHFLIHAEEIETVREWITSAGIRWGIDAQHRELFEQPPLAQNTWQFGLDRLLLGYAMAGNERRMFAGILPHDDVEGSAADLLGRVTDFCTTLFRFQASLYDPRPPEAWCNDLGEMLESMVAQTSRTARQHQQILLSLSAAAEGARIAGFGGTVDRDSFRTEIEAHLQRGYSTRGFLSGGVTFCELVPMRTIPFRVVCLMGMNDDAFPRTRHPLSFDLIAKQPAPGDRSQREDDRYLFLEALLSARKRLLVTYTGQSVRDNTELPPSVVVTELLDALSETFSRNTDCEELHGLATSEEERTRIVEQVLVRHPLQPFSSRYFGASEDRRLFSYSMACRDGARELARPRRQAAPFIGMPLPLDEDESPTVTLEQLVRFFEQPASEFLRRRLDLYLARDEAPPEDREPADLSGLERWSVGEALLGRALQEEEPMTFFESVRAAGRLPPGMLGKCDFDELVPEVAALARRFAEFTPGGRIEEMEVDREITGTRIKGLISDLWTTGQVGCTFGRIRAKRELGTWVRHVVWNWIASPDSPKQTTLVGRRRKGNGAMAVHFLPLKNPASVLAELVRLYWLGHQVPLPLLPETSREYADRITQPGKGDVADKALEAARKVFYPSSPKAMSERDDPNIRQVYGGADPFAPPFQLPADESGVSESFTSIARKVLDPLLAHRETT